MAARRAASIGDCCNLLSMDGRRFRLLLVGAVTPAAITKVIVSTTVVSTRILRFSGT